MFVTKMFDNIKFDNTFQLENFQFFKKIKVFIYYKKI